VLYFKWMLAAAILARSERGEIDRDERVSYGEAVPSPNNDRAPTSDAEMIRCTVALRTAVARDR
jgi:hypothetical protein